MSGLSKQQQLQQIQTQNSVFFSALNSGKITYSDYEAAMAVQKQREAELKADSPELNQTPPQQENPAENPYSSQNLAKQTFNPSATPEQRKTLADREVSQEERQRLFDNLSEQQETTKQGILKQEASTASASMLGLPAGLGEKYDLTNITVPEGYIVSDYRERPGGTLQLKITPKQSSQAQPITGAENSLSQQIYNAGANMPTLNLRGNIAAVLLSPSANQAHQLSNEVLGVSKNPLAPIAGLVASGENFVLNVPRLALQSANIITRPVTGAVDLITGKPGATQAAINIAYNTVDKTLPKPPTTLSTALLSGNTSEITRVLKDPEFAFGSIAPDLIMAGMGIDTLMQLKPSFKPALDRLTNVFKSPPKEPITPRTPGNLKWGASLDDTERLVNQPLPRSAKVPEIDIAEANAKINSFNLDKQGIIKKIDTQQRMSAGSVDINLANRKINLAVEQAKLEQAAASTPSSIIKMPTKTNLDYANQVKLPGKIDVAAANAKMDAVGKQGASYLDYRSVMGQGRTVTATTAKISAVDKALPNLEKLIKQPLPRSVPMAITIAATSKIANQNTSALNQNQGRSTMGLIPVLKMTNVQDASAYRMRSQMLGASVDVVNRLNQRNINSESASVIGEKITQQIGGSGLKIKPAVGLVSSVMGSLGQASDGLSGSRVTGPVIRFDTAKVTDKTGAIAQRVTGELTADKTVTAFVPKTVLGQDQSTRESQAQKAIVNVASDTSSTSKIKPGLLYFPRGGGLGLGRGRSRRGKWFKTFDPIPLPKQVLNQVTGRKEFNIYKQAAKSTWRRKRRK